MKIYYVNHISDPLDQGFLINFYEGPENLKSLMPRAKFSFNFEV